MTKYYLLSTPIKEAILEQAFDTSILIGTSATTTIPSNTFVFFAAFDGTDNAYVPVNGDTQNTAIAQLADQVPINANTISNYYDGLGTPGTNQDLSGIHQT